MEEYGASISSVSGNLHEKLSVDFQNKMLCVFTITQFTVLQQQTVIMNVTRFGVSRLEVFESQKRQ